MGPPPFDISTKKRDTKSPVQTNDSPTASTETLPEAKPDNSLKLEKTTTTTISQPLAPPPRPAPQPAVTQTPDYFSGSHSISLNYETNPFEHSFAGGGSTNGGDLRTPGGTKLPPVASLTSPVGLLASTPNFWSGLRSGPLSPAMLSAPQKEDYFSGGHHLRGGFPTPNESGLRSGLTPGGGGSMFPEPSPNSQALFGQLASGGATPTTLDFYRTAINAAAAQKREPLHSQLKVTSQPKDIGNGLNIKSQSIAGQFDGNEAADAANGLYLLAQTRPTGTQQQTNHYTMAPQLPIHAHPPSAQSGARSTEDSSTTMTHRNNGSISTNSGRGVSEMSGGFSGEEEARSKPNTRPKRKSRAESQNNGRRNEDTPSKEPANKKAKVSSGIVMEPEPPSEEEPDMSKDEYNANGKKMTDDEKRKNFLERNRVAALKCRQRKKQWLANLQQKVELFSAENEALSSQISQLRDEVVSLKTMLLAHKDCPVSQQQGMQGLNMQHMIDGPYSRHGDPYGMASLNAQHNQQVMAGQGMTSRFA